MGAVMCLERIGHPNEPDRFGVVEDFTSPWIVLQQVLRLLRDLHRINAAPEVLAERCTPPNLGRPIGRISAKFRSFWAISAPIFASKYAFCSIFQNLPDSLAVFLKVGKSWQNFANFATFAKILLNFHKNC